MYTRKLSHVGLSNLITIQVEEDQLHGGLTKIVNPIPDHWLYRQGSKPVYKDICSSFPVYQLSLSWQMMLSADNWTISIEYVNVTMITGFLIGADYVFLLAIRWVVEKSMRKWYGTSIAYQHFEASSLWKLIHCLIQNVI